MISEAHHIDCNKFLRRRQFRKKFFDLIVADPPYFSGPERRRYYGTKISKIDGVEVRRKDYPVIDSWTLPTKEWFERVKKATNHLIIWGANYFDFIGPVHDTPRQKDLATWLEAHPTGWIVWDKCNGKSTYNDFELAWTNIDMPTVVYRFMWNGMCQGKNIFEGHVMQGNKRLNEKRIHATQKPIPLYKWLFIKFAKPGFKILDTHLGSGSSRIAAYEMEYDFWGCEIHIQLYNDQEKRFNTHCNKVKSQLNFF